MMTLYNGRKNNTFMNGLPEPMPEFLQARPPHYHHFVLLVWEERDSEGRHVTWRFSLQDSQKEARIGFTSVDELKAYLESWMNDTSVNILQKKEISNE
jgi:hypothetical protein